MGPKYQELAARLADLHNLNMAYWLLQWDQNVYMPPSGADARAAQMATLQSLRHQILTDDKTARLIEAAALEIDPDDFDSTPTSLVRIARQDYASAMQLPTAFVEESAQAVAAGFSAWHEAKSTNNYRHFLPALQRIFDLKMRETELRGYTDHPYDVMLENWERGLTTKQVSAIFADLEPALIELTAAVSASQDKVDDALLHQRFPIPQQRELAQYVSTAFGVDYTRWARLDEAPHPFSLQISTQDIRLTTRFDENFFNPAFFGTLHETGHSLHGHGFAPEIEGTFLSDMELGSQAVCEAQSRLWENMIGRSQAFWSWVFPKAKELFPAQFGRAKADTLYRAVNKVHPQFIRVEADELTYNLHILLRFEIELDLVEGKLRLADAPEAWNAKFKEYFGIVPPTDSVGILQDIHWSMGGFGMFVGYAIGNIAAAQYYNRALAAHPEIPAEIGQGKFATLRAWLTENIYRHGRKYTLDEMTQRATGSDLQSRDYIAYLRQKFGALYGI